MRYHARMESQGPLSFGAALAAALTAAGKTQKALADHLSIDAGQVSRWVRDHAMPRPETVIQMEEFLGADLSAAFSASAPHYELYVSAPITGLGKRDIPEHHDAVAAVVESLRDHVTSLYWPGEAVRSSTELTAADITTERNMNALGRSEALIYLQFKNIVHPSSSLVELGLALGKRMKTTIFVARGIREPYMLDGFQGVAGAVSFLPKARIYRVGAPDEVSSMLAKNGREILGLS